MVRSWQGCFGLTVVVVLLQLSPWTGVFLMFIGGPFWSVLLINLGFVLMARDAIVDRERWMLMFPALWFGGYLLVSAISHWQAARFDAVIVAANAGKRLAFDPSRQDILIQRDKDDEVRGSGLRASALVDRFGLWRAYQADPVYSADLSRGLDHVSAEWLVAAPCPGRGAHRLGNASYSSVWTGGYPSKEPMRAAQSLCRYTQEGSPARPTVVATSGPGTNTHGLADTFTQEVALSTGSAAPLRLLSGWSSPLRWYPMPIMGCGLNSGIPAWQCVFEFGRESRFKRDRNTPERVIARALGLREITYPERFPAMRWH